MNSFSPIFTYMNNRILRSKSERDTEMMERVDKELRMSTIMRMLSMSPLLLDSL
jgi:hypothetical protein